MKRLAEFSRGHIGLVPQTITNTNVTGPYYHAGLGRRVRLWLLGGAMAATKTTKVELLQASDAAGTGAKAITDAEATVTANTLVTVATVALAAVGLADTVTVNGVVFTQAAATDVTAREFLNAAGLVACVNDATYGVEGVFASASGTDVTLIALPTGDAVLTVVGADVGGTVVVATTQYQAYVDVDLALLDHADDFDYVAVKVTTTATSIIGVLLDFYDQRYSPVQKVGASSIV